MSKIRIWLVAMLLGVSGAGWAAGDAATGKSIAKAKACATCHGEQGISAVPVYPNLAGQKAAYLISSLKAYKQGQRKGGMSAVMAAQATMLSDSDIEHLAAFYAGLK